MKLMFAVAGIAGVVIGVLTAGNAMVSGIAKAIAGVGFIGWFILQVFAPLWDEKPVIPSNSNPPKGHH